MDQSVANRGLRDRLRNFGNVISNPLKIKLIYANAYGKQINEKIGFITTDGIILKEKSKIEKILEFVHILDYEFENLEEQSESYNIPYYAKPPT